MKWNRYLRINNEIMRVRMRGMHWLTTNCSIIRYRKFKSLLILTVFFICIKRLCAVPFRVIVKKSILVVNNSIFVVKNSFFVNVYHLLKSFIQFFIPIPKLYYFCSPPLSSQILLFIWTNSRQNPTYGGKVTSIHRFVITNNNPSMFLHLHLFRPFIRNSATSLSCVPL